MVNMTALISVFIISGFVCLVVSNYLKYRQVPTPPIVPVPFPPPDIRQASHDIAKWPLKDTKYLQGEPFLASIMQVFEKQPWIEMGLVQRPNSISSRDAFVQSLCRHHKEAVVKAISDEKTKHQEEIKAILDGVATMLQDVSFECHRCQSCLSKKDIMGKYVDLTKRSTCQLPELLMWKIQQITSS